MKRILVVAAHPDDEVIGCGGTIARLVKEGDSVDVLILGEGVTARDRERDAIGRKKETEALKNQMHMAGAILGVKNIYTCDFPDNRFDSLSLLDIVKSIEEVKTKIKPDIIFTHHEKDLNIDHQITHRAVITATRPLKEETVKEIYSFEVLSSTEWNYPNSFSPDTFFNVEQTIDLKLKAMSEYKAELEQFPHPRSLGGIEISAKHWGMKVGCVYAEAFKSIRCIK